MGDHTVGRTCGQRQARQAAIADPVLGPCQVDIAGGTEHHCESHIRWDVHAAPATAAGLPRGGNPQPACLLPGLDCRRAQDQHRSVVADDDLEQTFPRRWRRWLRGCDLVERTGRRLACRLCHRVDGHRAPELGSGPGSGWQLRVQRGWHAELGADRGLRIPVVVSDDRESSDRDASVLWGQAEILLLERLLDRRAPGIDAGSAHTGRVRRRDGGRRRSTGIASYRRNSGRRS